MIIMIIIAVTSGLLKKYKNQIIVNYLYINIKWNIKYKNNNLKFMLQWNICWIF